MKKIASLLPFLVLPILANAQKSPIDKLFDKFYGKEGFTTVLVNKEAFEVISHMEKSGGEVNANMDKIERVRVIAQEDEGEKQEGINFMEELKGVEFVDYKELVVVKEADQEVLILAREDDGMLAELLILVGGEENVLVSVEGKFTMQDLETLSHLEGLGELGEYIDL